MVDPVAPRRDQLEAIVGGDNRLLTALERLFKVAGEITPELLAALQSAIETNAEGIAENVIDIELNVNDIMANAGNIATNTANIATNTAGIASNLALINAISSTQAVTAAGSPVTPTTSGTLLCDASLGAIVINLDPASSGIVLNVKKIDASVNVVTLTPTSGTIDGSISAPIAVPFLALTVVSNGTDWFIL